MSLSKRQKNHIDRIPYVNVQTVYHFGSKVETCSKKRAE